MTLKIKPGMKFGKLTTLSSTRRKKSEGIFWNCECECGNLTLAYSGHLRAGMRVSCGCLGGGAKTHGMSYSPEYKAWDNARSRCYNKKDRKYPIYGGRGIRMCESWKGSFEAFFDDMGRKPTKKHTLDRIDSDGDYEPGNCRWATYSKQNNNRPSFNRIIIVNGERLTVAQAAALVGIPHATILTRLDSGRSDKEAVSLQKLYGKKPS